MTMLVRFEQTQLLAMATRAHGLIDQFMADLRECPNQAWESLASLQEVLDELREFYPSKAFRQRRI